MQNPDCDQQPTLAGRELLLEVALKLFMDHGYEGVSMQQIASAAGMTKGSPYYHFRGKEDLFLSAYAIAIRAMNSAFLAEFGTEGPLRERLIASFAQTLRTIDPGMIRLVDDYHRLFEGHPLDVVTIDDAPPEIIRKAYEAAFAESAVEFQQSPSELADALLALQMGTMHAGLVNHRNPNEEGSDSVPTGHGRGLSPEELATMRIDLFLNGAIKRPR